MQPAFTPTLYQKVSQLVEAEIKRGHHPACLPACQVAPLQVGKLVHRHQETGVLHLCRVAQEAMRTEQLRQRIVQRSFVAGNIPMRMGLSKLKRYILDGIKDGHYIFTS